MSDRLGIPIGSEVPNFELETYDPVADDFGSINLSQLKEKGQWSVLFFYPADFTFV